MSENRKDIYYNEGALRILEALGAVDEELLERCGEAPAPVESTGNTAKILKYKKRRKPLWKTGRAWAACLGLLAVGFISWNGLRLIAPHGTSADSAGNTSGGAMNQNQGFSTEAYAEENEDEEKAMDTADTAGEASPGEDEGFDKTEDGGQGSDSGQSSVGGRGSDGGQDSDGGQGSDSDQIINRESQTGTAQEPLTEEMQKEPDSGIVSDYGNASAKSVSEEEARSWVPLGAYIPQNLPEGFRMENAYINSEEQSVTMTWSRGMDHIMISVSGVEPGTVDTVDIAKPETYDERLYEIPYAETVPGEYRESVDNPVFDFSDMDYETGLELMNSRMISYDDAGDTDTPRGRFSVLIEDEILLYFNGRGTPEEIWNMLYPLKR